MMTEQQIADARSTLWAIADNTDNYSVTTLAAYVLDDFRFLKWTASAHPSVHHYGHGGLIQHTLEVVETCMQMHKYYGGCDRNLLFLAALFHDFGKIWDYDRKSDTFTVVDGEARQGEIWQSTDAKHKIYHITKSVLEFTKANAEAKQNALRDSQVDEVVHAILSHHGRPEWKSAVPPQTKMAWILHLCDSMSARVADCDLPKDRYSK